MRLCVFIFICIFILILICYTKYQTILNSGVNIVLLWTTMMYVVAHPFGPDVTFCASFDVKFRQGSDHLFLSIALANKIIKGTKLLKVFQRNLEPRGGRMSRLPGKRHYSMHGMHPPQLVQAQSRQRLGRQGCTSSLTQQPSFLPNLSSFSLLHFLKSTSILCLRSAFIPLADSEL